MLSTLYLVVGNYGVTFIQTATTGILITHRHNYCDDGDACGDASSYHHHPSHYPAMIGKYQQMNTNFNRSALCTQI